MDTREIERKLKAEIEESKENDEVILLSDAAQRQKQSVNFNRYPIGLPTFDGCAKLDEENGGLAGGDLLIVSGPTGNGKTLLASTIAYNLLKANGIPSLFLTYEVSVYALWKNFEKMGAKAGDFICAPASHTTGKLEWVEKKVKEAKAKYMIGNVIIDHLGFLVPFQRMGEQMSQNYSSYLGQIVRELKTIAVKENISIILPVHMNKSASDNPSLRDIGHSGGIAQESDFVMLVAREENQNTKLNTDLGHEYYTPYTKVTLAKNRPGGSTPSFWMKVESGKLVETYKEYQSTISKKKENVFGN